MTRRDILRGGTAGILSLPSLPLKANEASGFRFSVEAYIFQQYADREHKPLAAVIPEVIPMAKGAGFRNIELNGAFFAGAVKEQTLDLLRRNGLKMPSVYSGGPMHTKDLATETIRQALEVALLCKPFGCEAVVCNADPKGKDVEKTDEELASQSQSFNEMGRQLKSQGFDLRVHNHTPEMLSGAREWRYTLQHTDPKLVSFCLDLDWVRQGDQDPLGLLKEAGQRVHEVHVRNSQNKLWLEDLSDGDIDYVPIAKYLRSFETKPLVVVELAYRPKTQVTRSLAEDLRRSRIYAEKIFGKSGN
jgi:sugar phosphate isomerase/epimerase